MIEALRTTNKRVSSEILADHLTELIHCVTDKWYWMTTYLTVPVIGRGNVPFAPWLHLQQFVSIYEMYDRIVALKARQLGFTYLIAAIGLHNALFTPAANELFFSKGETDSMKIIARAQHYYNHLPKWMRFPLDGKPSMERIKFAVSDSQIQSFPASSSAGRGETASTAWLDEWAFQPNDHENYVALEPTVEFGKMVGLSTANGKDNTFYSIFNGAVKGENDFHPVFIPYMVRPDRPKNFLEKVMRRMSRVDALQEYPKYRADAFLAGGESFFDVDALHKMPDEDPERFFERPLLVAGMRAKVWRLPQAGKAYVAAIDPARGGSAKADFSTCQILDAMTGEQVAVLRTQTELDQFGILAYELLRAYGFPYLIPEEQGQGYYIIRTFLDKGYPKSRMHYRSKTMAGWHTSPSLRNLILGNLEIAIRLGHVVIHDTDTIEELLDFGYNEHKKKWEAGSGHDDTVMALALAWHATGRGAKLQKDFKAFSYLGGKESPMKAIDWSEADLTKQLADAAKRVEVLRGEGWEFTVNDYLDKRAAELEFEVVKEDVHVDAF